MPIGTKSQQRESRDPYIDILKALGIISVVIGHSSTIVIPIIKVGFTNIVYSYHLMIFFFATGFLIVLTKTNEYKLFGKQFIKMMILTGICNGVMVVLRNKLIFYHALDEATYQYYDYKTIIGYFLSGFMGMITEWPLMGACWFISYYLYTLVAYIIVKNLFLKMGGGTTPEGSVYCSNGYICYCWSIIF